eukprot:GEMP01029156.1.p1 GENE.GEMP01029156.1~~GEMP01029156.1.p1  ORF type:complete len:398 (+),score=97.97 GEMP01029156.1:59-1252(+)
MAVTVMSDNDDEEKKRKMSTKSDDEEKEEDVTEEKNDAAATTAKKKKKKKKKKSEGVEEWARKALAEAGYVASTEEQLELPRKFKNYRFTGSLRPASISQRRQMPDEVLKPDYALHPDGASLSEENDNKKVIPVLDGDDLDTMREACRLGREVLDTLGKYLKAGVTGEEIDILSMAVCRERNIYPSPLGYYQFPKSVCVSPNEVICHGIPDFRKIEEGDIVNLDVSIFYKGFHSDLNETFFIGKCDEDTHRLVKTAYEALRAAHQMIKPGTLYRSLGNEIQAKVQENGCAIVSTYCGHGIGALFHGEPRVPHYRKNKQVGIMKPGHVFTIEPMVNLGSSGSDKLWPDEWTAVTSDGKRSAQFEHTFMVTETGCEILTAKPGKSRTEMEPYNPLNFQR